MIKLFIAFLLFVQVAFASHKFCDPVSGLSIKLPSNFFFEKSVPFPEGKGPHRSLAHVFAKENGNVLFEVFGLARPQNLFEFAFITAGQDFGLICKPEEALELVDFESMRYKLFDRIPVMELRSFLRSNANGQKLDIFIDSFFFVCCRNGFRISAQGKVACEDDIREIKKEAKKILESVRLPEHCEFDQEEIRER